VPSEIANISRLEKEAARQLSLDPRAYLGDNNAYAFFQALGDLVMTGPTTTNVGDVQMVLFR